MNKFPEEPALGAIFERYDRYVPNNGRRADYVQRLLLGAWNRKGAALQPTAACARLLATYIAAAPWPQHPPELRAEEAGQLGFYYTPRECEALPGKPRQHAKRDKGRPSAKQYGRRQNNADERRSLRGPGSWPKSKDGWSRSEGPSPRGHSRSISAPCSRASRGTGDDRPGLRTSTSRGSWRRQVAKSHTSNLPTAATSWSSAQHRSGPMAPTPEGMSGSFTLMFPSLRKDHGAASVPRSMTAPAIREELREP